MAKYLSASALDGGLSYIKANAVSMLLLKTYAFGDSYATVVGNALATQTMATGDFTLGTSGNNRTLTTGSKTPTASASSNQYDSGTATVSGSSTSALGDTSKSWATNVHANRAVVITGGTGAGQFGRVASNTSTVLTLSDTWAVAPDATSTYRISDDLHVAFTDGSTSVIWVTDESSNQVITSGNTLTIPAQTLTANQPT